MTLFTSLDALVPFARLRSQRGFYDGRMTPQNLRLRDLCRHRYRVDFERVAVVIFTRDVGHHTSGWWKNPDYERCFHLSISYKVRIDGAPLDHDRAESEKIARAFYGDDVRHVWVEGPYSPEGLAADVWHYRLFCDPAWVPFTPRGEVYNTDWTPAGWKSFSDIHGYTPAREDAPFLLETGGPDNG